MPVKRGRVVTHTNPESPAWSRRHGREKVPVEEQRKEAAIEKQKEKEKTQDFMKWHVDELTQSRKFNQRVDDNLHVRSVTVPDTSHIKWSKEEDENGSGVQPPIEGGIDKGLAPKTGDSQESGVAD